MVERSVLTTDIEWVLNAIANILLFVAGFEWLQWRLSQWRATHPSPAEEADPRWGEWHQELASLQQANVIILVLVGLAMTILAKIIGRAQVQPLAVP